MSQVRCIGAVVPADDEHGIQRFLQQGKQGILPVLRSAADGIEHVEAGIVSIPLHHGGAEDILNLRRLRFQHRGLIRKPDFRQMRIGVKAFGIAPGKMLHKGITVTTAIDIICHHSGICSIEYHQETPLPILTEGLGSRGHAFLVLGLAVNDAGHPSCSVGTHTLPHLDDIAAGAVYQGHPLGIQALTKRHRYTECRHDNHIISSKLVIGGVVHFPRQMQQTERIQSGIHIRVVDNLADEPDAPVLEQAAGCIGYFYSAVHTIAEAEGLRQIQAYTRQLQLVSLLADTIHQRTLEVG